MGDHIPTPSSSTHSSAQSERVSIPIYTENQQKLLSTPLTIMGDSTTMPSQLEVKDAYKIDTSSFPYIFEENAAVPLKTSSTGIVRVNVYRPKSTGEGMKLPVLVTYGPYGKDIHYKECVQSNGRT